jgi:hypothetical protein
MIIGTAGSQRVAAQSLEITAPVRLADVEIARSQSCVAILSQVEMLDVELDPLAERSRRLMAIAEAISIEDRSVTSFLDPSDPVESDVQAWFASDSLLAVRFIESGDEALHEERRIGRESVTSRVLRAMGELQAAADSVLAENQDVVDGAGPCDGAVFVRPAVLEACTNVVSELCAAAQAPPSPEIPFLFAETAEDIWGLRDLRPWAEPEALRPGPNGLDGGRTIGFARIGNVVVTAAFAPLLKSREEITPAELFAFEQANQALALTFNHPDIAFAPGLALQAALPAALADEDGYIVHFGEPSDPDTVWRGDAGTGAALEASVPMSAAQVLRLRDGEGLTLTAVLDGDPVYSIALATENQAASVSALLSYMASGLGTDLLEIVPPKG